MARYEKSEDSRDDDFDPHNPSAINGTSKKTLARQKKKKPAGTLEVKVPTAAECNKALYNTPVFGGLLPTPAPTATAVSFASHLTAHGRGDSVVSTQYAVQPPVATQSQVQLQLPLTPDPLAPSLYAPVWNLKGMLRFDDEVLDGQLHFSRRGMPGHTSRDTADIWLHILRLFFPSEEGYDIIIHNYREQDGHADLQGNLTPGTPVTLQLWKVSRLWRPDYMQWWVASSTPVLTVICGSVECSFSEFPGARHKHESHYIQPVTPMQVTLYKQLHDLMQNHNHLVQNGHNQAQAVKNLNGVIACGTVVRFFKVKLGEADKGWMKSRSTRGLDMVNGVPSDSLTAVERALKDVKTALTKSGKV